ncbi:MAG: phage holin family protein [Verrucomicrobiota bacterium]|jgi:putative membrane protein
MKLFLKRWFFTTVAVLVATQIVPGITADTPMGLITATLLLGILNAVARPVMIFLSLPLVVLSLGLFILFINALLLWWVGHMNTFHVDSFYHAFLGSVIISVVTMALNMMTSTKGARVEFRGPKPPSPPPPGQGGGPIIDV